MTFNTAPAQHARNARLVHKGAPYRAAEAAAPPATAASSLIIYWKNKKYIR